MWLAYAPIPLATSITPVDAATGSVVGYLLSYGPLGLIALALAWVVYKGSLVPSKTATADRDAWRKAYEDECAAHQVTREALAVANDRAEVAVESARVTNKLLEAVQPPRKDSG